jgi:hypothetical protein
MNNTRTGKIARLPDAIRQEINQRLRDGATANSILEWLNPLPEVKAILDAEFKGELISDQNLTNWRSGGYHDWQRHQENIELFASLQGQDYSSLNTPSQGPSPATLLGNKLVLWTLTQLSSCARLISTLEPEERWDRLRELSADLARLRRTEAYSEFIRLQAEWLALDQANSTAAKEKELAARLEKALEAAPNNNGEGITPELFEQVERELRLL